MGHSYGGAQAPGKGKCPEAGMRGLRGGREERERGAGSQASWLFRAQTGSGGVFLLEPTLPCPTPAWHSGPLPGQTSGLQG